MPRPGPRPPVPASLFVRIYATIVVTILGFVAIAAVFMFLIMSRWGDSHVAAVVDRIGERNDEIVAALADDPRFESELRALEREFDARVQAYRRVEQRESERATRRGEPRGFERIIRPGQAEPPAERRLEREEIRQLRRGRPLVRRQRLRPPVITVPLHDDDDRLTLVLRVESRGRQPRRLLAGGLVLFFLALAGGTWTLARSLTARLERLEGSTRRLAAGDLSHRAKVDSPPADEIDHLAVSFNEMAERVESVVKGQKTLLADVSHELRTPIARMRVLTEILDEKVDSLDERLPDEPAVARLARGFDELKDDLVELERLVDDLLTSGRLDLDDAVLHRATETRLLPHLTAIASRFDALVELDPEVAARVDDLLFERLFANLLANARRACPDGPVRVVGRVRAGSVEIAVEDEGPGVLEADRARIFEPFTRLDEARSRDRGGVGLGLHISRKIVRAHGGELRCEDRPDGRGGARFVVTLPVAGR